MLLNYLRFSVFLLFIPLCFLSCEDRGVKRALEQAGNNKDEIRDILHHFEDADDPYMLPAAKYLIRNMPRHFTSCSRAIDSFTDSVRKSGHYPSRRELNRWWKEAQKQPVQISRLSDLKRIKAAPFISYIERSVIAWEQSPWRHDVNFETFCQGILPYRFMDEPLIEGSRDSLYQEYKNLIRDEQDVRKAFAKVYHHLMGKMFQHSIEFPYQLNPLDMERVYRGSCLQRCVLVGHVMRSLGIPVVIDGVREWGNYSTAGHSWLALVLDDGTYTLHGQDSIARKQNPIDSSVFLEPFELEQGFPYPKGFVKRCAKVFRTSFDKPVATDVSEHYHIRSAYQVDIPDCDGASLCIYKTGKGWKPFMDAERERGRFLFRNIADSVAYLVMVRKGEKMVAWGNPFMLVSGKPRPFIADRCQKIKIGIDRKYPLMDNFLYKWIDMRGASFEASNDKRFRHADTLLYVSATPVFRNVIPIRSQKKYRYVRMTAHKDRKPQLSEIELWAEGTRQSCIFRADSVKEIEKCFDGDVFTSMMQRKKGYQVEMELPRSMFLSHIIYYMYNDDNFVVPGQTYELFYYDREWVSLGTQLAKGYSLTYCNVPTGALLLLKNRDKGQEERIFVYENDRQIWL